MKDASLQWRAIPGMLGCHASERGDIRGPDGVIRKQSWSKGGYILVSIDDKSYRVNRLVCAAFHKAAPTPKHEAAHKDGRKSNNSARNLKWKTHRENEQDKVQHGTHKYGSRGPEHFSRMLSHKGKRQSVTSWANEIGTPRNTIYTRLHRGWSLERALT